MVLEILNQNRQAFDEKFAKLQKRFAKLNQPLTILSETASSFKHNGQLIDTTLVEISDPEINKIPGTTYIGMISFKNGIKQIYSISDKYSLGTIEDDSLTCDHCHINRARRKYFFFEKDGKLLTVGSSCVLEYTGIDPTVLNRYTIILVHFVRERSGEIE